MDLPAACAYVRFYQEPSLPHAMPSFDTLKYAHMLEAAGFTSNQAEAQSRALADALASLDDQLATKADVETLKKDIQHDMQALRLATKTDVESLRKDMQALRLTAKADIEALEKSMQHDMQALRGDMRLDMQVLSNELKSMVQANTHQVQHMKWMIGVVGLGLAAALPKLYFP